MLKKRIVVTICHDGKGNALKPIAFCPNKRKVGSLIQHIKILGQRNVDELVLLDINATVEGRNQNYDLISRVAEHITCPLAVGGGINNKEQVRLLMNAGADKIVVRSYANSRVLNSLSRYIGQQSVVMAMDIVKPFHTLTPSMSYKLMVQINDYAYSGVGEFIFTSVLHDGRMNGYDLSLIKAMTSCPYVNVINGGCGTKEHMLEAFHAGASSVAASSVFLFTDETPKSCAEFLSSNGVPVRHEVDLAIK